MSRVTENKEYFKDGLNQHNKVYSVSAGGIDTRIRDLKIISTEERELGFDRDFFKGDNLIRFPILETFKPEQLYRRSQVLQR